MQRVQGGYLVLSAPAKDIKRLLAMAEMLSGSCTPAVVLEHLEKESAEIVVAPGAPTVPIGACYLATGTVFPRHHQILNCSVQPYGTYTYLNRHGKRITVRAYSGASPQPS
jgi:ketopantoate hydroxymethyltransferase